MRFNRQVLRLVPASYAASNRTCNPCRAAWPNTSWNRRDHLNFDQPILRQPSHLHRRPRRRRHSLRGQILSIDGVHRGKVIHVLQKDYRLDHASQIGARRSQDRFQVFQHPRGLLRDAAWDESARFPGPARSGPTCKGEIPVEWPANTAQWRRERAAWRQQSSANRTNGSWLDCAGDRLRVARRVPPPPSHFRGLPVLTSQGKMESLYR